MNTLEVLKKAYKIIKKQERWCQYFLATDKHGASTDPRSATACRFCAMGAIQHTTKSRTLQYRAYDYLAKTRLPENDDEVKLDHYDIFTENDRYGHPAVLEMYRKAIQLARKAVRVHVS